MTVRLEGNQHLIHNYPHQNSLPQGTGLPGNPISSAGLPALFQDQFVGAKQAQVAAPGALGQLGQFGQQMVQQLMMLVQQLVGIIDKLVQRLQRRKNRKKRRKQRAEKPGGAGQAEAPGAPAAGGVPKGFLWKPVSESDGKCVVLLPSNMTGKVKGVTVRGPNGRELERGDYKSVANGGREHYRFNKPGGQYPAGCYVEIEMKDGTSQRVRIDNPGQRVE